MYIRLMKSTPVQNINKYNCGKDLSIFIDKNISFDHHISHLRKCCYAEQRKISTIRPFINERSTVQLCVSLILSKIIVYFLECQSKTFKNYSYYKITPLVSWKEHISDLAPLLYWKNYIGCLFFYRVNYKIALIVFKCINVNDFPAYLKDLICI